MWKYIVRMVLRYRVTCLIIITLATVFMGYKATRIVVSQDMTQTLPPSDSISVEFKKFKQMFGEDGSLMFIGIQTDSLFSLKIFNEWYDLSEDIKAINGVDGVVSMSKLFKIERNDSLQRFDFVPMLENRPTSQAEVDSLKNIILGYKFYDGLLFNAKDNVTLMMVSINKEIINTTGRVKVSREIDKLVAAFSDDTGIEVHISGMPYIRTVMTDILTREIILFSILSLTIASAILLIFFRSAKAVIFPVLIAIISTVWSLGLMVIFGYKITAVSSVLPPIIIIICIENCIFLINRYYSEYQIHQNRTRAISKVIGRIGQANFLTNLTTAIGFGSFIITGNLLLSEFGIIASLGIMIVYILTLVLIPIMFSYTKVPKIKAAEDMRKSLAHKILNKISRVILKRRRYIYITSWGVLIIACIGMAQLQTSGSVVDDLSKSTKLYTDIAFLEEHFKGVFPFEFSIDTKKKNGVMNYRNIEKINELQEVLATYPEFSKPLSVAEFMKAAKQSYYYNDSSMYDFPSKQEMAFIIDYFPKAEGLSETGVIKSMVDSTMSVTRLSVQMANISSKEIYRIMDELRPKVDSIFPKDKYDVKMTGTCIVFAKGSDYMVRNLTQSLILALTLITLLMAALFRSGKMIIICLISNILPLLVTAALMGYLGITIKTSTILVFSAALGISVDNSIHFLSRYRLYLGKTKKRKCSIKEAVMASFNETGYSMMFSSIVLFFGFIIFSFSSFGGTQAMGYLIAFTLFTALLCNLFLLPSLLLWLGEIEEKRMVKNEQPKIDK